MTDESSTEPQESELDQTLTDQRHGWREIYKSEDWWAIWFATEGASEDLMARLKQPQIVSSVPEIGDKQVDPTLAEIRITFDQEMGGGLSLTGGGTMKPKGTGRPQWSADKKTLTWPVALEPNHNYRFGINSYSYKNFSSAYGVPVKSRLFAFRTAP